MNNKYILFAFTLRILCCINKNLFSCRILLCFIILPRKCYVLCFSHVLFYSLRISCIDVRMCYSSCYRMCYSLLQINNTFANKIDVQMCYSLGQCYRPTCNNALGRCYLNVCDSGDNI